MKAIKEKEVMNDLFKTPKEKVHVVAQKNDLIQKARHELTVKELKLVDFMISKIKANDEVLYDVETSIREINEVMDFGDGGKQIKDTCDALMNLRNKGFFIEKSDSTEYGDKKPIVSTSWLAKVQINPDNTCILQLDKDLAPYLLNLIDTGNYTQFHLLEILSLKSKYSLMLYRLSKSFQHLGGFGDTVNEFKKYFGREKNDWNQFNQKYLKPAVEEINEKTDMKLTVNTHRRGKSVSEVYIIVEEKRKFIDKPEKEDIPKVPLHNWLK